MTRRPRPLRVAIDTGGTFTDCVWIDSTNHLQMLKVFSTPADPSQAIIGALRKINHKGDLVILHGTTVGTNTLLERKGARTALVTTSGFEDAIEIGRQARPKLYDFFFDRIEPLVPADLRFGVEERTASDGKVLISPSPRDLKSLASHVEAKHPESVAISLLFCFANPENERAIAESLRAVKHPAFHLPPNPPRIPRIRAHLNSRDQCLPSTSYAALSGKSVAAPFEGRATQGGAALQRCVKDVQNGLGALAPERPQPMARIFVMQSSGGITSLGSAATEPVRTVLSGPAGGVVGAAATALRSGFERIIAFDMGGTSTDVSLVEGAITPANQAEVAGLPIGVPVLDIHTVGAGGGSLARFDSAGALRVGPESAGADPGPICYGRGTQPTVTDANLLLGRLQPTRFLGGDFTLDLDRTCRVTREWLKQQGSPLTIEKFAAGVIRVVNSTMEKAIRVVSVERGRDPRDFALVAFGGAGGLHACALAEALSIPHVIVPALPGALSALGILFSDVVKDYSRTVLWRVAGKVPRARLEQEFAALKKQAAKDFQEEAWKGRIRYQPSIDVRYRGQGYELNLPLKKNLRQEFEQEHQRRYGYAHPTRELELVTLRLRATVKSATAHVGTIGVKTDHVGTGTLARPGRAKLGSPSTPKASVQFEGKKLATAVYSRDVLKSGKTYHGPALIIEYSATSVIHPGKRFHLDSAANLIVTIR